MPTVFPFFLPATEDQGDNHAYNSLESALGRIKHYEMYVVGMILMRKLIQGYIENLTPVKTGKTGKFLNR